jgi:hypothetical protein
MAAQDDEALSLLLLLKSNQDNTESQHTSGPSSSRNIATTNTLPISFSSSHDPDNDEEDEDDYDEGVVDDGRLTHFTMDDLRKYFHLPIIEVAKQLGVCTTLLKKACRRNQIQRWPYRQIRSITKSIHSLETAQRNETIDDTERLKYKNQILHMQHSLELLLQNPNAQVGDILLLKHNMDFCESTHEDGYTPRANVAAVLAAAAQSSYHPPDASHK